MKSLNLYKSKLVALLKSKSAKILLFAGIYLIARVSFAEDALAAAEPVVKDTYNGSVKTYLYVGEAIAAIVTLIFTRNIKTLGGVFAVVVFLNIVAKLAGF